MIAQQCRMEESVVESTGVGGNGAQGEVRQGGVAQKDRGASTGVSQK